jgi:hypothetical protein
MNEGMWSVDMGYGVRCEVREMNMGGRGYRSLEMYQSVYKLAADVHRMSLTLPKHETYAEGSQIPRLSKSVPARIVEGYCLYSEDSGEYPEEQPASHISLPKSL